MKTNMTFSIGIERALEIKKRKFAHGELSRIVDSFLNNYLQLPEVEQDKSMDFIILAAEAKVAELKKQKEKKDSKRILIPC